MRLFLPEIKGSCLTETVRSPAGPEEVFSSFARLPGSAFLNSSLETDTSRYSFMGIEPFFALESRGANLEITIGEYKIKASGDPFETLRSVMNTCKVKNETSFPFISGGIGYFSYDLKNMIEDLPRRTLHDVEIPDMRFVLYQVIVIHDRQDPGKFHISALDMDPGGRRRASELIKKVKGAVDGIRRATPGRPVEKGAKAACRVTGTYPEDRVTSTFTREEYISSVKKILEHIRRGDIYQACLSRRSSVKWHGRAYDLYRRLNEISPAPFSAYLNAADHHVISSSPELFLRRRGDTIETRPMKGTRPRGNGPEKDLSLREELAKSQKDISELLMIVDLERNDLGRISVNGSIEVTEERRIEPHPTVFQAIAVVRGKIAENKDNIDILKAAFPGGSISGCPKIRAMEIIDELEPASRGIYTGAIGYMSFHDTMDLNIAIRTMVLKDTTLYFGAGGGIVSDSDPEKEYEEILVKSEAMFRAIFHKDT